MPKPEVPIDPITTDMIDLGSWDPSPLRKGDNMIEISDEEEEQLDDHASPEKGADYGPIEAGQKRIIVKYNELEFPVNWD